MCIVHAQVFITAETRHLKNTCVVTKQPAGLVPVTILQRGDGAHPSWSTGNIHPGVDDL